MPKLLKFLLHVSRPIQILKWIVIIAVAIVILATVENPVLQAYLQERDRCEEYRAQVDQLRGQQQEWQTEVADLKSGGYRLEKAIHERFPMLRPGQKTIIFHKPGEKPADAELEPFDPAKLPELPPGEAAEGVTAGAAEKTANRAAPEGARSISKTAGTTKDAKPSAATPAKTKTQSAKSAKTGKTVAR